MYAFIEVSTLILELLQRLLPDPGEGLLFLPDVWVECRE
jgi:hypothetical protein